jgi:cyanate lyase
MTPEEIKSQFVLQKKKQKTLADKLGVHRSLITLVMYRQKANHRVRKAIARELGIPVRQMFPDRA